MHADSFEDSNSPQGPYWETRVRGPMVEDPHVAFAPHISAYSPAYDGWPPHPETVHHLEHSDPRVFAKRRSMSIDHRTHYADPRMSHLTQPRPTSTLAGPRASIAGSMARSPTGNPLAEPTQSLDSLRREIDILRRENDQLRAKKP